MPHRSGSVTKVLFTGFLRGRDVDRVYQMADCYVMPSVSDRTGIVPLEAMRNDVPMMIPRIEAVRCVGGADALPEG
ncbi:MAG: glycosyltransferase [Phycisphaerales bacterium]